MYTSLRNKPLFQWYYKMQEQIVWFLVAVQTFKKMIKIELCIDVLYIFTSLNRWGSRN